MKNPARKTKRSKAKNPALVPGLNSRVRQEYLDYDYLDQLSPDELAWLNKFTEESNNASFKNDGTDLITDPVTRKAIYDNNNARNRCLYGQIKSKVANTKLLNYEDVINMVEEELGKDTNPMNMENAYVDFIDNAEVQAMLLEYDDMLASLIDYE